jgi:predicted O-linked N-acetylglucosamine transferase (SPINDLY family)
VLKHLQLVLAYVRQYENIFVRQVASKTTEEQAKAIVMKRKALAQNDKRIAELDLLFQKLFEGNATGAISGERFLKMSEAYESEQAALKRESAKLEAELAEEKQTAANTERFLSLVHSYTEIEELSPTILNEFIEKIVVHAPDKSSGHRQQKVEIFYNSVDIIDVPDEDKIVELLRERKQRRLAEQQANQTKTA